MTNKHTRKVVMWRRDLLPGSETFVRSQLERLQNWDGVALGMRKIDSPLARTTDVTLFGDNRKDRLAGKFLTLTGYSRRLQRKLQELRPDVVHAHFAIDAVSIAPLCALLKIPYVVSVYGMDVTAMSARPGLKGLIYRQQLKLLFAGSSKVLAVSSYLAEAAKSLGASAEKVTVHRLGIELTTESRNSSHWDWDVLLVGRLVQKKGADDLISAAQMVEKDDGSQIRVAIIGDGPLRPDLVAQASAAGVSVDFLGAKSPEAVRSTMKRSRILAVPSKTAENGDSEGLPMILLEGAALGMPIVASRHSGIPEFIEHDVTGLLSEENDISSLAGNIQRLLADEALATSLARNGLDKVSQDYNIEIQAARLEKFYEAAVNGRT